MVQILYSQNGYQGAIFSREFAEEFTRRTGRLLHNIAPSDLRYDSDIITLVELRGPLWSAGPGNVLSLITIPDQFRSFFPALKSGDVAVDDLTLHLNRMG